MNRLRRWAERLPQLDPVRGRTLALVVALLALMAFDTPPQVWLRLQLFDEYQRLVPRERVSAPAVVVQIDERSLATYGQWPWPRTRLADLVQHIAEAEPAAIGFDIVMPEPDRLSPRRIVEAAGSFDALLKSELARLPDNDERLAAAIRGQPVVLGVAGLESADATAAPPPGVPLRWHGDPVAPGLRFAGALRTVPQIESAAAGHGLINTEFEGGQVRRMPLLGQVGDVIVPTMSVELLRVAAGVPALEATSARGGLVSVRVGDLTLPTASDGRVWLRYGHFDGLRYVSARDVLEQNVDPGVFDHKIVLVAETGIGLVDWVPTPLGERVPGIEIHMQLLENIFDGAWLTRPAWAGVAEAAAFIAVALLFVVLVPARGPWWATAAYIVVLIVLGGGGLAAFMGGWLLDAATPAVGGGIVLGAVLGMTLAESQERRRDLARRLQAERELAARLAGELEAARRVQIGMLPDGAGVVGSDARVELEAFMEPARTVGGDLYDFFRLDDKHLFVAIGDVSGKGLPAALFMALVKAMCKSAVLRSHGVLDQAVAQAEAEIGRDNTESLFVTLFAMIVDLETGAVAYCNAGHEPPYALLPGRDQHARLDAEGGPPLCVMPDFAYPLGRYQLSAGETICLVTDGIADATNAKGEWYGRDRLEMLLGTQCGEPPRAIARTLKQDLAVFAIGTAQADDVTAVILRWNGAGGPPA